MAFGDTSDEISAALFKKLTPWLYDIVDFHDVEQAYKLKGQLEAREITLKHEIDRVEKETVLEHGQPRSNEARKLKLGASKELRDQLTQIEADLKIVENQCKWMEFRRDMLKSAIYRTKVQFDL